MHWTAFWNAGQPVWLLIGWHQGHGVRGHVWAGLSEALTFNLSRDSQRSLELIWLLLIYKLVEKKNLTVKKKGKKKISISDKVLLLHFNTCFNLNFK